MQYKLFFLLPVTLLWLHAHAQSNFSATKHKNFYVELGGNGSQYSVNYECLNSRQLALRGGIEVFPQSILDIKDVFIGIPVTYSFLYGKGNSKLEVGEGILTSYRRISFGYDNYTSNKIAFSLTGVFGYRYQRPAGGFMFRAGISPFYVFADDNIPYADKGISLVPAISIGYTF